MTGTYLGIRRDWLSRRTCVLARERDSSFYLPLASILLVAIFFLRNAFVVRFKLCKKS